MAVYRAAYTRQMKCIRNFCSFIISTSYKDTKLDKSHFITFDVRFLIDDFKILLHLNSILTQNVFQSIPYLFRFLYTPSGQVQLCNSNNKCSTMNTTSPISLIFVISWAGIGWGSPIYETWLYKGYYHMGSETLCKTVVGKHRLFPNYCFLFSLMFYTASLHFWNWGCT